MSLIVSCNYDDIQGIKGGPENHKLKRKNGAQVISKTHCCPSLIMLIYCIQILLKAGSYFFQIFYWES